MGANILIVEDEEPLTTLLRYNLEAERLRGRCGGPRRRGRYAAAGNRSDLIVLDWMLPGLSGIECAAGCGPAADAIIADHLCSPRAAEESERGARARHRRRRLSRQAVFGAGTHGAYSRIAARRQSRTGRMVLTIGDLELDREKNACRDQSARSISGPTEIPPAGSWMGTPGRSFPGTIARPGCGAADVTSTIARSTCMSADIFSCASKWFFCNNPRTNGRQHPECSSNRSSNTA